MMQDLIIEFIGNNIVDTTKPALVVQMAKRSEK